MWKSSKVLVTTTSSLEGITVKQYLKPISAHVVTGTNFFSDVFAALSDIFGGRSNSYQRQLSSIYNEAIQRLEEAAIQIGANCILGLKVDLDEVSGKGKSMFMITAVGTAVIIEKSNPNHPSIQLYDPAESIDSDALLNLHKRKSIAELANAGQLTLNSETWRIITEQRMDEVAGEVMKTVLHYFRETHVSVENEVYVSLFGYLESLPSEIRTIWLYESLMNENDSHTISVLFRLISDLRAFSPAAIEEYLNAPDSSKKHKALQLAITEKSVYTREDIKVFERFAKLIERNFKKTGTMMLKKGLFSAKETEMWVCRCGTEMEMDDLYCIKCGKDIYGFDKGRLNPEKTIRILQQKVDLLREYFTDLSEAML